ncbi:UNVERIFIED_CONTAM: hypothetical protein B566_EDAN019048 [Ephemera danica]|nr:hypothetical protein B566_EDAN019048 [Ephemera danica]
MDHIHSLAASLLLPGNLVPKQIAGDLVTGSQLIHHIRACISLFNSNELPEPKTIYDNIRDDFLRFTEIMTHQREIKKLRMDMEQQNENNKELQKMLSQLQNDIGDKQKQIDSQNNSMNILQEKMKEAEKMKEKQDEILVSLHGQLKRMTEMNGEQQKRNDQLKTLIDEQSEKMKNLEKNLEEEMDCGPLTKFVRIIAKPVEKIARKLDEANIRDDFLRFTEIMTHQREIKKLRMDMEQQNENNKELQKMLSQLQNDIGDKQKQIDSQNNSMNILQEKMKEAEKMKEKQDEILVSLHGQLKRMTEMNGEQQKRNDQLKTLIDEQSEKMKNLEKKLEEEMDCGPLTKFVRIIAKPVEKIARKLDEAVDKFFKLFKF